MLNHNCQLINTLDYKVKSIDTMESRQEKDTHKSKNSNNYSRNLYAFDREMFSQQNQSRHTEQQYSSGSKPDHKKYPKSPCAVRNQLHNHIIVDHFTGLTSTELEKPQKKRSKHKKGKSMDIEHNHHLAEPDHYQVQKTNIQEKVVIDWKYLNDMRSRNTISQLKEYPKKRIQKKEDEKKVAKNQLKKGKISEKDYRKQKKGRDKCIQHIFFKDRSKNMIDAGFTATTRPSKHLTSINSNHILNKQYKSMELFSHRCKSSVRDKIHSKSHLTNHKPVNDIFPFPSKVNSLYSNTTSLFCSKADIQLFPPSLTNRIHTEIDEEMQQVRQYEQKALLQQKISKDNVRQPLSLEQSRFEFIDNQIQQKKLATQKIIDRYLSMVQSKAYRKKSESESLVMELMSEEFGKSDSFKEYSDVTNKEQEKNKDANQALQKPETTNKLNQVIKLICETEALGEESRSVILTKIREIIPIADIGSKQLKDNEHYTEKQQQSKNHQIQLTQVIKVDEPQIYSKMSQFQSQSQLYNLNVLDSILNQRQQQLELTRRKQLQRLESNNTLNFEQKMNERQRIVKWYNLKIQQSVNTREQIWKGFNLAKMIIGNNPLLKNLPEKDENQRADCKRLQLSDTLQQNLGYKQLQICIPENEIINISVENKQAEHAFQINTEKQEDRIQMLRQQQYSDQIQFGKEESSDSPESADSALKKFIFLDSVQKISYDYEQDSPDQKQCNNRKRLQKLQCEMSEEPSNLSHSDDESVHLSALSSPPPILTPYSILSQQEKQDIFQYIFIDLCIQLSDELYLQSKAFIAIQILLKSQRQRKKRTMGFNFNSIAINDYLKLLIAHIKSQPALYQHFCKHIEKPIGPTSAQLLRYLRINQDEEEYNGFIQSPNVIEQWVFGRFDRNIIQNMKLQPYFDDQSKEKKRVILVKNAVHIFHKAIFDAYNEILDKKRPFGQWGQPLAWKSTAKFKKNRSLQEKQALLQLASDQLLEYTRLMYGLIIDKQHCNMSKSSIPEGYLQKWQNQRLFKILQQFLDDIQEKLRFIDDQQAQSLIRVSQSIEEILLQEILDYFIQ